MRGSSEPMTALLGRDVADHDVRVTEFGTPHHHLQPLDENVVATPVHTQRALVPCRSGGLQVGDDVAAAERVDRLFGVTDQNQGGLAAESAIDHVPLHWIGVLELVDHHHRPPLAHPDRGGESGASNASASRVSRSS